MSRCYRSFAKINLHLQVVARREDGFHELRTLFQTVEHHDLLTVSRAASGVVELVVLEGRAPAGEANLAARAARAYLERWAPEGGVRLELRKRIAVGGGLGGGSSNAATTLRALQDLFGSPAGRGDLWSLARELGADVPYFLVGGTALGFGRGDEVVPVAELPETEIWLVSPPLAVSTAEVFAGLGDLTARPLASSIWSLAQGGVQGSLETIEGWNDLEGPVLRRYPVLEEVHDALRAAGATLVRLSGSGASSFARFPDPPDPAALAAALPAGSAVQRTRTLSRTALARRGIVN